MTAVQFITGPRRTWYGETAKYRADVVCPESGEPIPLYSMSISKFTDGVYLIHCPDCAASHQFTTTNLRG